MNILQYKDLDTRGPGEEFAAPKPGQKAVHVREEEFGKLHSVFDGAPCEWSAIRGATHTLWINEVHGSRPARLLKTVLYVGNDEVDDQIVWDKWQIRQLSR